jgi:uncharacterized protein YdhG (YjbR/CyaY superfamily)
MKAAAAKLRAKLSAAEAEAALQESIAKKSGLDHKHAVAIDKIVKDAAPQLAGKTWYGMPAWALGDKTVLFFQSSEKFKTRYATLGFSEHAKLDDGDMWPNAYALVGMTPIIESRVRELIVRAVS